MSIFGATDVNKDRFGRDFYTSGINNARNGIGSAAFDNRTLGMSGLCRINYRSLGEPLDVTLEEGNVTTTCSLMTYEPESCDDIPFDRDSLTLKVIMRAPHLLDAIQELSSMSPERLTMSSSPTAVNSFTLSASGHLGSASVNFAGEPQLLETFQCYERSVNVYKFSMIKAASKAMAAASKVSIRADDQGVLSLQFMIDVAEPDGKISFVDFRFVPFVPEPDDEHGDQDDEA